MTDRTRPPVGARPDHETTPAPAPPLPAGKPRPSRTASRSRIAAVGIGVAAMVGLVSNMEVAGSHAKSAGAPAPASGSRQALDIAYHRALVNQKLAAARLNRPIVLTPHTVVHTVAAPSSGGSGGGGYVSSGGSGYAAAPAAAAPVASTSGSTP